MNAIPTYLPDVLVALAAMTLALMSPGPNVLAVIGTSMRSGRPSGVALALGVASGTFVWVTAAVIGLTALLNAYAGAVTAIRIAGGCYLLYLGCRSLRSAAGGTELRVARGKARESARGCYRRGLTVQLTNPKAALAMTAIVTLGIDGAAPPWVGMVLVLGVTALSTIGHLLYAVAFSTRAVAAAYARGRRAIETVLGAFFCVAGARLLLPSEE